MKILGVDIGTTSISTVVFENSVTESKTIENGTFIKGEAFEKIQDPKQIWEKVGSVVTEFLTKYKDIEAIGLTGQMHGIVYLDENGEAVSPLYTWQDARGDLPYDENHSYAGYLSELTGHKLATGYGMVTHFYNIKNNLVPKNAVCFCTIMDYVAMKLAGLTRPKTEPTNAAGLGLFDLKNNVFDEEALAKAGIDKAILPEVAEEAYLGTDEHGVPVYAAIGDNQAAFLGSVGENRNALLINVGTGSQVAVYTGKFMQVKGLETRPFPGGGYLLVGASLCGGRAYAMLEKFFRETVKMVTGEDKSAYSAMDKALREAEDLSDAPKTSTTFQGTRENPNILGSVTGIGTDNFTPVHLIQSFMNGMAEELYDMYSAYLEAGGEKPKVMIGSGNGLRKNSHLCRTFEEIFGCKLILSECEEEAAAGTACFVAGNKAN
ncbi:MAG: FGGY family carbohydrate kinase [Clostridia bacterium]|nr:FGGY family carbohydrate kinase [Clostridia bacterium]